MKLAMFGRAANDTTYGTSGAADLLAAIVNSSYDAIISTTLDGRVTSWNPAASELFGYHPEEIIGKSVRRLIPSDRQDEEGRILARIKAGERIKSYVTVRLDKEQRPIDVSLTISPIWDQNREIVGASKIIRTVASQKDGLEALRWRQFVDQAPVAIMMLDRNMRHLACSRRWIEDYLFEDVDITGRSLYEVFPEVPERWKEAHRRALAGEVVRADEDVFVRADGRVQWVRWEARPWVMSDRTIGGITIMSEDVTDKVLALRAVRESELRMRLAQEAAKAGAWEWRLSDNTVWWSESAWNLFGRVKSEQWEPIGETWETFIHPADLERATSSARRAVELGQEIEAEWRLKLPEGEPERWFLTRGRPIADENGALDRYFGVIIEITERKLAEKAVRESEMRMRLAQEAAKAGAFELCLSDNRIEWPETLWSSYGLQKPERWDPTFEAWASLIHPADRERTGAAVIEAATLGQEFDLQWRLNVSDGEPERWLLTRGKPITDANGAFDRYFGVVIDITQQKLMEGALRESEMRMRLAQEAAKAGAWEWRLADNSLKLSDSLWSLYGVQKPEGWQSSIEGWVSIMHPADRERVIAAVMGAVALGHDYEAQWRLNVPDGEPERWFLTRGRPIADPKGSPDRYFGVVIDITEQKLMEGALRTSEVRMHLAQEAARSGAWEWQLTDNRIQWSDSLWSLYGVPKPKRWDPSLDAWRSLVHPADREHVTKVVREAVTLGQELEVQWRLKQPEGEPDRWFLSRGRPLADADGTFDRYFGVIIEITEQKRMEANLRESKERQSFLLSLNDALRTVADPFEAIAIASKMLGQNLNAAQVVYAKIDETKERASITHEWNDGLACGAFAIDRIDDFAASLIEGLKNGQTVAVSDVHLDPRSCNPDAMTIFERGSIAAFITVPFIKNGRLAGGLAVHKRTPHAWRAEEITLAREVAERTWEAVERAHVAQALRDSEDRLQFALEAGEVGSWEMSLETRRYTASDQALSFFDFPPGTLPSYEEVIARIHPDDRMAVDKALQRTAETGQTLRIEFRRLLPDGSMRWLDARAERRSVSGRQFMGGLVQDITERVSQKEAVERAAKAKSEFLSNMSHELRTPMHAILGYSEICTTAVKEGEDIEKYLNNITTAGERLLILLNDLLDLAKMEAGRMEYKFEYADLSEVVEHALIELDPLIKAKKLEISVRLEEHTAAHFDRAHLIQVLINLISNAIKFSNPGSQIGIDLSEDRVSSGERGVRCRVADEGPGIPDDELEAVFDKFVQSKKTKTGKGGTGLGLAICDHIIKAHGGVIWAENARPHGAVFTFVVPKDHDARGHATNVGKPRE